MKQKIDKKNKSSCIKYSAEEVSALLKTLDDEYNSKFSITHSFLIKTMTFNY